jgi:hypothetical protein
MQELVDFLIEERYCNSELEAVKILESVSDSFYEYLIEAQVSAIDATAKARREMDAEMRSPNLNPKKIKHFRKKITGLKGAVATELAQRSGSKSLQKTPTGRGSRIQKGEDEPTGKETKGSYGDIDSPTSSRLDRIATELTGIRPGSGGKTSVYSPRTSTIVSDRYKDQAVSGAGGTRISRSGGVRGVRRA